MKNEQSRDNVGVILDSNQVDFVLLQIDFTGSYTILHWYNGLERQYQHSFASEIILQ